MTMLQPKLWLIYILVALAPTNLPALAEETHTLFLSLCAFQIGFPWSFPCPLRDWEKMVIEHNAIEQVYRVWYDSNRRS